MVGVTQEKSRLFDAANQFLLALAAHQPLGLFFDDVQWADSSTLAMLASLANTLAQSRVLILYAYRGAETNPDLEKLIQMLSRASRSKRYRTSMTLWQPHGCTAGWAKRMLSWDKSITLWKVIRTCSQPRNNWVNLNTSRKSGLKWGGSFYSTTNIAEPTN